MQAQHLFCSGLGIGAGRATDSVSFYATSVPPPPEMAGGTTGYSFPYQQFRGLEVASISSRSQTLKCHIAIRGQLPPDYFDTVTATHTSGGGQVTLSSASADVVYYDAMSDTTVWSFWGLWPGTRSSGVVLFTITKS